MDRIFSVDAAFWMSPRLSVLLNTHLSGITLREIDMLHDPEILKVATLLPTFVALMKSLMQSDNEQPFGLGQKNMAL